MRVRLCRMLFLDDRFLDVVQLLEHLDNRSFIDEIYLCESLLALEVAEANRQALTVAERAIELAVNDAEAAQALALAGKALIRVGEKTRARQLLHDALDKDPANANACKRMAALDLAEGHPEQLLETIGRLTAAGVSHASLFAAKMLAQAACGDVEAARDTVGDPCHHRQFDLSAPTGWSTMAAFNSALAEEMLSHPGRQMHRYGSASNQTVRIESPDCIDTPAVNALSNLIIRSIQSQMSAMNAPYDAWASAMPRKAFLRTGCLITDGEGYEDWHAHESGWMSGVYYVRVPGEVTNGSSANGCLAFGLPDHFAGAAAANAYGERLVRPREGMLLTFPSHAYHRTYPHETGEQRICFAFDVRPLN